MQVKLWLLLYPDDQLHCLSEVAIYRVFEHWTSSKNDLMYQRVSKQAFQCIVIGTASNISSTPNWTAVMQERADARVDKGHLIDCTAYLDQNMHVNISATCSLRVVIGTKMLCAIPLAAVRSSSNINHESTCSLEKWSDPSGLRVWHQQFAEVIS